MVQVTAWRPPTPVVCFRLLTVMTYSLFQTGHRFPLEPNLCALEMGLPRLAMLSTMQMLSTSAESSSTGTIATCFEYYPNGFADMLSGLNPGKNDFFKLRG